MQEQVSVIIPTFNRAFILEKTIPTYVDKVVGEIIIVDDCSTDNTKEVILKLQKKYDKIKYIKLQKKAFQVGAKNKGIEIAKYDYIYFGDDDSILVKNSIAKALKSLKKYNADIVGIKALYAQTFNDIEYLDKFINKNNIFIYKLEDLVNIKKIQANFTMSVNRPTEVPFTQACFIAKRDKIKKIKFDIKYKGNCYREETDFLLECNKQGLKIYYISNAIQINYPRFIAKGGSHTSSKIRWYYWTIKNNYYFLKKNINFLNNKYNLDRNITKLQLKFTLELLLKALNNLKKRMITKMYK